MAMPAETREYNPGSSSNSKKTMRLPPRWEIRPDSAAFHAEQFHVPIKHVRNLDLLDGTPEIPQEHCQSLQAHRCHQRNAKELSAPQINSR